MDGCNQQRPCWRPHPGLQPALVCHTARRAVLLQGPHLPAPLLHLCSVEDVLEELLGQEIVDETDT